MTSSAADLSDASRFWRGEETQGGLWKRSSGETRRIASVDDGSGAVSCVTHVAQLWCSLFGAVMADAAMLDAALEMDAWGREQDADGRRA